MSAVHGMNDEAADAAERTGGGEAMTDESRDYGELVAVSRKDRQLLDFSVFQESAEYVEEVVYSPAVFSQVSLPYKNPGNDTAQWIRRNGPLTMRINPQVVIDDETGEVKERRYPYGIFPRQMVTFLTTEARRTNSRHVQLGDTLTAFMKNIGVEHTGPAAKRIRDHIQRFFASTIKFEGYVSNAAGSGTTNLNFTFAEMWNSWTPTSGAAPDISPKAPWDNEVILSERFFNDVVNRPVPLDMNALRALGNSPIRVDLYLWLAHRMSYLTEKTYISWKDLNGQFGAQYKEIRQFRAAFRDALAAVGKVYPGLNVEAAGEDYLILFPSRTPIAKRPAGAKPSRIEFTGDRKAIGR